MARFTGSSSATSTCSFFRLNWVALLREAGVKFERLRLDRLVGLLPAAAGASTSSSGIFTDRMGTPESWTGNSPRSAVGLLRRLMLRLLERGASSRLGLEII